MKTRRDLLGSLGALASVSAAGCIGSNEGGDEINPDDWARLDNGKIAPGDSPWRINFVDYTGTTDGRFKYPVDPHELAGNHEVYDDNFQTVRFEGINEDDWKEILRDDLTETKRPPNHNSERDRSNLERFIHGNDGDIQSIFDHVDYGFSDPKDFDENSTLLNTKFGPGIESPDRTFRDADWAERLYLGLLEGVRNETNVSSSGGVSRAIYPLFRKYAKENLDKEIFDDFHIWINSTESTDPDNWSYNHSMFLLGYEADSDWKLKLVEPTPPGHHTDRFEDQFTDPEERPYFQAESDEYGVSTFFPEEALRLTEEGELSINENRELHNTLLNDLRRISDTAGTHGDSARSDFPDYAVWFSKEFRDSVYDTFTGEFSQEDLMDAVYTSRGLVLTQEELGYDKPLAIEGELGNPVVHFMPEDDVEELVDRNYGSLEEYGLSF